MKNQAMKIKVALLFGGKSTEHDISVISALQAYNNLNKEKYDVYPINVTRENELFFGERTGGVCHLFIVRSSLAKLFSHLSDLLTTLSDKV